MYPAGEELAIRPVENRDGCQEKIEKVFYLFDVKSKSTGQKSPEIVVDKISIERLIRSWFW